jgi:hypothetical protein
LCPEGNKMSSHPTSKARRKRQKLKRKYARLREDCQLAGIIETTPEGAVRNEVAPVASDPPLPHLVRAAIKDGWATPDAAKAKVVGDLLAAFFEPDADPMLRVWLARLLLLLDQTQWERDHPESSSSRGRGGAGVEVNVNLQNNIQTAAVIREMIERGELGIIEEARPPPTGAGGRAGE